MEDMFEDAKQRRTADQELADKKAAEMTGEHPPVEEAPRVFPEREEEPAEEP